jgi:hypothetical protein
MRQKDWQPLIKLPLEQDLLYQNKSVWKGQCIPTDADWGRPKSRWIGKCEGQVFWLRRECLMAKMDTRDGRKSMEKGIDVVKEGKAKFVVVVGIEGGKTKEMD